MTKLSRVLYRRFGADINVSNIGQFGSAANNTKFNTKDVSLLQALDAWLQGWTKAVLSRNKYPTMQERNAVDYVHGYQIDYMLREGIPEYDSQTEYNETSIVKSVKNNQLVFYRSLLTENKGQDLDNVQAWQQILLGQDAMDYSLNLLKTIYPVGSIYIGTTANCPLASLFGTWELVSAGRVLQGADENHIAGTTIAAGLPNHQHWTTLDSGWGESPFNYVSLKWDNGDRIKYTGQTVGTSWASQSNSIYGASNTVQPPAYVVNIWRRTA